MKLIFCPSGVGSVSTINFRRVATSREGNKRRLQTTNHGVIWYLSFRYLALERHSHLIALATKCTLVLHWNSGVPCNFPVIGITIDVKDWNAHRQTDNIQSRTLHPLPQKHTPTPTHTHTHTYILWNNLTHKPNFHGVSCGGGGVGPWFCLSTQLLFNILGFEFRIILLLGVGGGAWFLNDDTFFTQYFSVWFQIFCWGGPDLSSYIIMNYTIILL